MQIQQLTKSDSATLLELWNSAADLDPLTPALLQEKIWDDPGFDQSLLLGCFKRDVLAGWAMGVVREQKAGRVGYIKLIAVAPSFQSQGVGNALMNTLEERLFASGAVKLRPFESNPNYLLPGLDPRYTKALLMLQKRGYERFGETCNLLVDLDQRFDEGSLPKEFISRQATPADQPRVEALLQKEWPGWLHEVRTSFSFDPPRVHIALPQIPSDGQPRIAGFAAYDGNNIGTGWFGPMGTAPEYRGRGIGAVLLKRCLRDLKSQARETAIIPWVGPIPFYAREVNARINRVFHRFHKMRSH